MASITKRGKKWVVRWRQNGKRLARTCPDKRTAQLLKLEAEQARALGRAWTPASDSKSLEDVAHLYIQEVRITRARSTAERYSVWLSSFIDFGGEFSKPSVLSYLEHCRASGLVDSNVAAILRFWRWAFDEGHTDERPRRIPLNSAAPKPTIAPTWAEMDRLCSTRLHTVLRFTGLRLNQALGLTWDDWDGQLLHVRPELGKTQQERSGRLVPVSPHLARRLGEWEQTHVRVCAVINPRQSLARWTREMWENAGVDKRKWDGRPHHAFRKGFVSGLIELGARREAVEYLVGHSLGLRGIYTDPRALGLVDAVGLIPDVGGA